MKIYILKKSLSDLKNPIARCEYETFAATVGEFIAEMVEKNYAQKPVKDSLAACKALAQDEFADGSFYIVNKTKDTKYGRLSEELALSAGDEIVLIKLKYVRGLIW